MKFYRLRKELIVHGTVFMAIFMAISAGNLYVSGIYDGLEKQNMQLRMEINALQAKLDDMSRKAKEIVEATKLWQKLNIRQKKREGLKIDTANHIIDDLKQRYRLVEVSVDLSTPNELTDIYKTDTVSVISSDVNLKIKGISDEQVLSFIDTLMKELPGYIKLKSLTLKRSAEINNDIITRISKGDFPELVFGELVIQWRDLKDLPAKKQENSTAPQ